MEKLLKTDAQVRRETLHAKIVSLHRSMVKDNPTASRWAIYRTLGQRFGLTQQGIYVILKRYNEL